MRTSGDAGNTFTNGRVLADPAKFSGDSGITLINIRGVGTSTAACWIMPIWAYPPSRASSKSSTIPTRPGKAMRIPAEKATPSIQFQTGLTRHAQELFDQYLYPQWGSRAEDFAG